MKLWKNKLFWRFLIPSIIGIFLFVTPIQYEGNLSIPIAVASGFIQKFLGDYSTVVIWVIISLSAILTILHKIFGIPLFKRNPKLDALFGVKGIWFIIRMLGFVLVNMIYFGWGPDFIIGELTGGFVSKTSKQENAKELLRSLSVITKEIPTSEIREKAIERGFSWRTMELVIKELGIQSKKVNNVWYWILDSKYF